MTLFGGEGSFGHGGAGGSYGFADPEHGLAVGYVMNKMAMEEFTGDARSHGLIRGRLRSDRSHGEILLTWRLLYQSEERH